MIGRPHLKAYHQQLQNEWETIKSDSEYNSYAAFRRQEHPTFTEQLIDSIITAITR